ncbi:MAG: NAD-glutamate dehydrogenase, partial [Rhodobacterales bacterium]|nr:NAD-glutamate dehydrogenase [Rhodobacterales bacterium]
MPSRIAHQQKSDLIARVAAEARDRMGAQDGPVIAAFIEHYYANVPPKDLVAQGADALFGAALAHWKAALARTPGHSLVRVYTPSLEEHGWNADHTVVEVVTDDMPFLVDSVTAELNDRNLAVHLVIHPVFAVTRDAGGRPAAFAPRAEDGKATGAAAPESLMHVKISEQSPEHWDAIRDGVAAVLDDVRASVEDWQAMRTRMEGVIDDLGRAPKVAGTDMAEVVAFLQWIHDNHYTFLGYRDYTFKGRGDKRTVHVDPDTGLGVLRDPAVVVFRELQDLQFMSPDVRGFVEQPAVLFVTKANKLATVHRRVHMDAIGIKRFDKQGKVVGERVFVGLFTSAAYNRSARDIPLLRHKVRTSLERAGFATNGHDGKALINILETFPRDELFQISEDELLRTALGILHLQERQRVALFVRRDDFERFVSCLIYVPRDRYTTDLRRRLQAILEDTFAGTVTAHYSQLGDSALARLHIIVQTRPGEIPDFEVEEVEARLVEEARSWADRLQEALVADQGEEKGLALMRVYQRAFKSDYRERFNAASAVNDVRKVERALAADDLELSLYRPIETAEDEFRFKVYHKDRPLPLSDVLPMLENMGLKVIDEVPHAIRPLVGDKRQLVMLHDFGLRARDGGPVDLAAIRDNFQETFRRVWQGDAESDDFNSLILHAGLNWREVVVIRAYCKYLRQAGIAFSQAYMEQTLAANPAIARSIVALFRARFDPALGDGAEAAQQAVRQDLDKALEQVVSADEDRILRRFINIVESSLRTNFYQTGDDGMPKPYLSFKLDSRAVDELPLPRPLREIFVYSPRVEGVHLRFGLVARGGLRWSVRRGPAALAGG